MLAHSLRSKGEDLGGPLPLSVFTMQAGVPFFPAARSEDRSLAFMRARALLLRLSGTSPACDSGARQSARDVGRLS